MSTICEICHKTYASYQSLWIHNKKFHKCNDHKSKLVNEISYSETDKSNESNKNNLICSYCNKNFSTKYTLNTHYKSCSIKKFSLEKNKLVDTNNTNIIIGGNISNQIIEYDNISNYIFKSKKSDLEVEIESNKLKLKIIKEQKEVLRLKLKLHNSKTTTNNIKIINNKLMNFSNNLNIINNFNIVALGKENILETLRTIDKKDIMKSRFSCLEKIVDIIHCKDYDQFKNIIITNLKDDYAYKYDDKQKTFKCVGKDEALKELIDERVSNLREIYEELATTNKIDDKTKYLIQQFLKKMDNDEKYIEECSGLTYKNFRAYKEQKVKILIYNNSDKISKDLAIILDDSFNDSHNTVFSFKNANIKFDHNSILDV